MPTFQHKDLTGPDLHPPKAHTHPDTDLSSLTTLDGRYYQRAAVDAALAANQNLAIAFAIAL